MSGDLLLLIVSHVSVVAYSMVLSMQMYSTVFFREGGLEVSVAGLLEESAIVMLVVVSSMSSSRINLGVCCQGDLLHLYQHII